MIMAMTEQLALGGAEFCQPRKIPLYLIASAISLILLGCAASAQRISFYDSLDGIDPNATKLTENIWQQPINQTSSLQNAQDAKLHKTERRQDSVGVVVCNNRSCKMLLKEFAPQWCEPSQILCSQGFGWRNKNREI